MGKIFLVSSLIVLLAACAPKTTAPIVTYTPIFTVKPFESLAPPSTKTSVLTIAEIPSPITKPPNLILDSPNGEFVAEFDNAYRHPATQKQVIEIFGKNGSLLWEIPYQHETSMSYPHPSLSIYGWSKDSVYLYFYYIFSPDGGDRAFWWNGFDLQRINVQNGDIEQVIKGEGLVAFAFSPDEMQIAYTRAQDNPSIIFIRNLSTGAEQTANVILASKDYVRVGDIHWSPTGNKLAFQTETNDYIVQTILLNPVTMKQKLVREYELFTLLFDGWANNGKLQFSEISANGMYIQQVFQIDSATNEMLVIGTPTPRP